jgi:hypothetical protein
MKIYNDVLTKQVFEKLRVIIFSSDFPWYYMDTTAYKNDENVSLFSYSFYHIAYDNNQFVSPYGPMLELAILNMLDKTDEKIDKLFRIRLGMITITPNTVFHSPHVDGPEEHRTGLFYMNTSDGNTTIFNERFNQSSRLGIYEQAKLIKNNLTPKKIIKPEENQLVLFDGLNYHQSSTPTTVARRIVINFNYTTKK